MCRGSVQLCKTNIKLMWPLSWQADNTAAVLYILNIITFKSLQWITFNVTENSPSWEAYRRSATHSIPCLWQNTQVHYYFHHSLTHTISPNFFGPHFFCSQTYSSLNNITIEAHRFSALQMLCWHTKMRYKKVSQTNNRTPNIMFHSYIGSSNIRWT